ncbi:uncharacterized protein CLUP02_13039 [Colletotrichum lupini]|uniref:Ankyrin n=1 Tax=Colletotrichum lupini TaxID=145971 RepID=A0A9Q8WL92_9PEZI|nr:uncharacterized protein CLUP02_13039 [Colletotrichum lupini]UQC87534.1 hypothetical protein CLUP02_13039 [Colletotrichum lupini]
MAFDRCQNLRWKYTNHGPIETDVSTHTELSASEKNPVILEFRNMTFAYHRRPNLPTFNISIDAHRCSIYGIFSTPLQSITWGYREIVSLLIDEGADPNLVEELQWKEFQTPICWAVEYGQEPVVRTFLAKINALQACEDICSEHRKPLMLAFESQSEAMVKLLLAHGADFWGYCSNDGPLAWAAELGRYNMVQTFLQHETQAYEDRQSHMFSALMLAAESGHGGIVELLLEDGALEGQGAYQIAWDLAECFEHEEVMTTLDPYVTNEDGDGKIRIHNRLSWGVIPILVGTVPGTVNLLNNPPVFVTGSA